MDIVATDHLGESGVPTSQDLDDDHRLCLQVARFLAVRLGRSPDDVTIQRVPEHDPSEDDHPVDLIVEAGGEVWAIEHTLVETFENQLQDNARLSEFFDPLRMSVEDFLPEGHYQVVVPVGVVDGLRGPDLDELRQDVEAAIRSQAHEMYEKGTESAFVRRPIDPASGVAGLELHYRPPFELGARSFEVARWRPDESEQLRSARVQRALYDKLPKLHSTISEGVDRTVLILEDRDIALSNPWLVQDAVDPSVLEDEMADWTVVIAAGSQPRLATVIFEKDVPITERVATLSNDP